MPVLSSGQVEKLVPERHVRRWSSRSLTTLQGKTVSYAELYRIQPAVRTVVGFLARHVSQMGMRAYVESDDGRRERLGATHPLSAWCDLPGPRTGSVPYLGRVVSDLALYDAHLSVLHRSSDGRVWTSPVPRHLWEPVGDSWLGPEKFRIGGTSGTELTSDKVIHIAGYEPEAIGVGCSPMESLRQTLAADFEAESNRAKFWKQGAVPSYVIERPLEAPDWGETARDRFMGEWDAAYGSGGAREGRAGVLEEGMTLKSVALTAKDSQYLETRKLTREEVAAAFDIPGPLVGILDHATFSNITEQHRALYSDVLGWWFRRLEQVFVHQLVRPHYTGARYTLSFDEWERLRGSASDQAKTLVTAAGGPILTRNEARGHLNLAPVDDGDELITPLNVLVGGQPSPNTPTAVPEPETPKARRGVKAGEPAAETIAELLERHLARQKRATLSRLGPKKATDQLAFDVERFEVEMADDLEPLLLAAASSSIRAQGVAVTAETVAFVAEAAVEWSGIVNTMTSERVGEALRSGADVAEVFDLRISEVEGLARSIDSDTRNDAAERVAGPSRRKRWRTTSSNPRAAHAALNGVSVAVGEKFGNGQRWPGDRAGSDNYGCKCEIDFVEVDDE